MKGTSHPLRQRRRGGLGTLGYIVWALIILGIYSGWKFMPVVFAKGRIERKVEYAMQKMPPTSTEEDMRLRIVTKGSTPSIPLSEENVSVFKEKEHGKRIFHVSIDYPNTVRYLGSDRTVNSRVQLTHVIEVDEVALARQQEHERRRRAAIEADDRRAQAFARKVEDAYEECEGKHGKGNCTITETYGGDSNSIVKMY